MTRGFLGTTLWIGLAACIGVGLFVIKHEVKLKEQRLDEINADIRANQESVHVLRAEWAYLNDPVRLRGLAEKYLGMRPVQPNQIASLDAVLQDGLPALVPSRLAEGRTRPISPAAIAARAPAAPAATGQTATARLSPATARTPAASPPRPAVRALAANPPAAAAPAPRPAAARPAPALARAEPAASPAPVTVVPSTGLQPSSVPPSAGGRGGRSIVIRSPALAQGAPDIEAEAR